MGLLGTLMPLVIKISWTEFVVEKPITLRAYAFIC